MKINKRKFRDFCAKACLVLLLLMQIKSLRSLVIPAALGGGELRGGALAINLGLYGLTVPYTLGQIKRYTWVALRDKLLLFLIGLVLASVMWSIAPKETLRRSLVFLAGTYLGIYLATRYSIREQTQIFSWMLGIAALLSLVVALTLPKVGREFVAGDIVWIGIFGQKNALGRMMCTSAVLLWLLAKSSTQKWLVWGAWVLSVGLIFLADSATSLLTLVIVLSLLPFYRTLRQRDTHVIPVVITMGLLLAGLLVVFFVTNPEVFFKALGRDPTQNTLWGRMRLWADVFREVKPRLWLGYGFQAFWFEENPRLAVLQVGRSWASSAHNGYLDVWVQFGLLGLIALIGHLVSNFRRGVLVLRFNGVVEGFWSLAYLTFVTVTSVAYSTLLDKWTVFWTFYVALTLSMCVQVNRLGKKAKRKQLRTRQGIL